jgi:dCMP deaminase
LNVIEMPGGVWENRFLVLAEHIAQWSKDDSTKVGAVIVDKKRIISLGFNGFPQGVDDKIIDRDQKLRRTIHSEVNAITFANRSIKGFTMFVTHPPCSNCTALIVQSGISTVVWRSPDQAFIDRWGVSHQESLSMMQEANVTFFQIGNKQ